MINKNSEGFTIVEMVISIFVLIIAVIGVYNAFSTVIILTSDSADRLTASYLAQEGIEIVRNIRDTNWIHDAGSSWTDGLDDSACSTNGCQADYTTMGAVDSPLGHWTGGDTGGNYLNMDENGFYSYNSNGTYAVTKFRRRIKITSLNDHVLKVSVEVFWNEKPNILNPLGSPGSMTAEENLYNWY